MKFNSNKIVGLFSNQGDVIGQTIRSIELDKKIVLSQGFGISEAGVPLRFLAYIVPVLHLLKQLPKTATAEFYFAVEGVRRANPKIEERYLIHNYQTMAFYLGQYVRKFHPDILNQVHWFCETSPMTAPAKLLRDALLAAVWDLYDSDPALRSFADKRGGSDALRYMVEHALYMRDPLLPTADRSDWLLLSSMALDMQHLIMIGGPAERIFHRVRQHLCRKLGVHNQWTSHQFWTPIGDPPTYHRCDPEPHWCQGVAGAELEPILRSYCQIGTQYRKNILRDFLVLLIDASGWRDFSVVGEISRQILQGRKLDSAVFTCLNKGLEGIGTF